MTPLFRPWPPHFSNKESEWAISCCTCQSMHLLTFFAIDLLRCCASCAASLCICVILFFFLLFWCGSLWPVCVRYCIYYTWSAFVNGNISIYQSFLFSSCLRGFFVRVIRHIDRRCVFEHEWLFCFYMWPCEGLVHCPGCPPPSPVDSWDWLQQLPHSSQGRCGK